MRKTGFWSMIAVAAVASVMGFAQAAWAATGDQFTGNSRIAYRNVEGKRIYSIPSNFENTHTTWNVGSARLSVTRRTNLPKTASWNIRYQSIDNGQIQFQYFDKYNVAHTSEIFTVRHGLGNGYTWDIFRELNVARVQDSDGNPYTPTGIWFTSGTTKQANDKLIGNNTDGYSFPQFTATNFNLIVEANGQTITYSLASGANRRLSIILPLPAWVTDGPSSSAASKAKAISKPEASIQVRMSEKISEASGIISTTKSEQEVNTFNNSNEVKIENDIKTNKNRSEKRARQSSSTRTKRTK